MTTTKKRTGAPKGASVTKRQATTPRKAPSVTPKPKVAQVAAVVDAAVGTSPVATKGNVVLVSIAKGLRVFHDASGRRRFIAGGERFEVDSRTAKLLLVDDTSFAVAIGLEPTDAGNPERLTTPALSGAVTTEDLGVGGRIGAEAEQAKAEAEAEAKAKAESETSKSEADPSESGTSPVDAANAASSDGDDQGGPGTPADDSGATASDEAGTPPSSDDSAGEPGAVVLT